MQCRVCEGGVLDDGKDIHPPGALVEIEDKEAAGLIKAGKVREARSPSQVVVDLDDIVEAIGGMDKDDDVLWTKSHKPKTEVLSSILKKEITAKERDAAWAIYQDKESR